MFMADSKNNPLSFVNPVLGSAMDFAINNAMAGIAAGRQFGYSRKMFDYTFAQQNQRQDWLNANSALIQKQSLKNAGLSASNLNGTPFSANVATGSGLSGSAEFAQMNMLSNMLQAKQVDIQDKLANADIALKQSEVEQNQANTAEIAANASAMRDNLQAETRYKTALYDNTNAATDKIFTDIQFEVARLQNETKIANKSVEKMDEEIRNLGVQTDINIKNLSWVDRLMAAQVTELRSRGALNNAQASKAYSDIQVNNENIQFIKEKCALIDKQAEQLGAYTSLIKEDVKRSQFDNDIREIIGRDAYIKLEKDKMLEPMYNNALAFQQIRNMETNRRSESFNTAVNGVVKLATLGMAGNTPTETGHDQINIKYDKNGDYAGHTETRYTKHYDK